MTLVGVDVGGGGIRAVVHADGKRARAELQVSAPRAGGRVDAPALTALVQQVVADVLHATASRAPEVLALGVAGHPDLLPEPDSFADAVGAGANARIVALAADAVTTHAGALNLRPGTVVAAGTGAVALGTDFDRHWRRTDARGHLLGDEGSGAWIGRAGLAAALRAADGRRGGSEPLLVALLERFGTAETAVARMATAAMPAAELAAFAPAVAAAAAAGDSMSGMIWEQAGEHLAAAALAASHDLPPVFSWGGALFRAGALLLDPFEAAIRGERPDAVLTAPAGDAADGALRLAMAVAAGDAPEHPGLVSVHRRRSTGGES